MNDSQETNNIDWENKFHDLLRELERVRSLTGNNHEYEAHKALGEIINAFQS
jgi:hypothetical protein